MTDKLTHLTARWARAGVLFGGRAASKTPDPERLLIDTARHIPRMARLFAMSATWLCRYGDLVARHRLRRLATTELDHDERATLGLLLETAAQHTGTRHLHWVIEAFEPATQGHPLFAVDRSKPGLWPMIERRATPLQRKWNLWAGPFEPKYDALRTPRWIMEHNPTYRERIDLKGDLRCSILATLHDDPDAGESVSSLADRCGATMAATLDALELLDLSGRLDRQSSRRGRRPDNAAPAIQLVA